MLRLTRQARMRCSVCNQESLVRWRVSSDSLLGAASRSRVTSTMDRAALAGVPARAVQVRAAARVGERLRDRAALAGTRARGPAAVGEAERSVVTRDLEAKAGSHG